MVVVFQEFVGGLKVVFQIINKEGLMEWIIDSAIKPNMNVLNATTMGFCILRICSNKKNCSGYECYVLLT